MAARLSRSSSVLLKFAQRSSLLRVTPSFSSSTCFAAALHAPLFLSFFFDYKVDRRTPGGHHKTRASGEHARQRRFHARLARDRGQSSSSVEREVKRRRRRWRQRMMRRGKMERPRLHLSFCFRHLGGWRMFTYPE